MLRCRDVHLHQAIVNLRETVRSFHTGMAPPAEIGGDAHPLAASLQHRERGLRVLRALDRDVNRKLAREFVQADRGGRIGIRDDQRDVDGPGEFEDFALRSLRPIPYSRRDTRKSPGYIP